jgi:NAD(P)H-dependent FMN reductase
MSIFESASPAPVRILGIGGSVRETSITRNVLTAILDEAAIAGAETVLADVHALDLPLYNPDIPFAERPAAYHWLLEQVRAADAFIIASPTYHGTVPGALKNVLDCLHITENGERITFEQRPVGVVAYGGPSAMNVVTALTQAARSMRGFVVPTAVTVASTALNEAKQAIVDPMTQTRVRGMVAEVLDLARLRQLAQREAAVA